MQAFGALADPTRRRIVEMLAERERSAGEIVDSFSVSAPAISQHLKVLREANLVSVRVDAQRRIYQVNPEGLAEMEAWLDRMRRFWNRSLDLLEQQLRKAASVEEKPTGKKGKSS